MRIFIKLAFTVVISTVFVMKSSASSADSLDTDHLIRVLQKLKEGKNEQALINFADSISSVIGESLPDWLLARLYHDKAASYLELHQNDSAITWFKKSLLKSHPDSLDLRTSAYEKISHAYHWIGEFDSAIVADRKVLGIYKKQSDSVNIRRTITNLGLKFSGKGDNYKALEYQFEGYELAQKLKLGLASRTTLVTIANTYVQLEEYDKANQYFWEALGDEQDTVITDHWRAVIHWNIGALYQTLEKYDSSIVMLRYPFSYWKNLGKKCLYSYPASTLAHTFMKMNAYDSAYKYANMAVGLAEECGSKYIQASGKSVLAEYYYHLGNYAKAEKYWQEGFDGSVDIDWKGDIAKSLYQLYEEQGKSAQALKYLKEHMVLNDSALNKEKIRDIAKLEKEYEVREERLRLEGEYEAQLLGEQLKSERANRLTLILAVVVLAILVISVLIYRLYHVKKQANDELVAKNQLIEQQKTELEALNAAKEKMISLLSHDIRNPLFGLEGSLNMLIEGAIDEEDFKQSARNTRHKLRSISDFLDNMLRWAKSQLTGINPNMRSVDAAQLLNETIDLLQVNISAKQLTVENHVKANTFVKADYEMIQTVVRNVLSNAIKFTPKGNKISVDMERQPDGYLFSVSDEGVGFPEGQDIFDMGATFGEGTEGEAGTGLGLALAKEFVEKHDGRIWAESTQQGAVVKFTIPT